MLSTGRRRRPRQASMVSRNMSVSTQEFDPAFFVSETYGHVDLDTLRTGLENLQALIRDHKLLLKARRCPPRLPAARRRARAAICTRAPPPRTYPQLTALRLESEAREASSCPGRAGQQLAAGTHGVALSRAHPFALHRCSSWSTFNSSCAARQASDSPRLALHSAGAARLRVVRAM